MNKTRAASWRRLEPFSSTAVEGRKIKNLQSKSFLPIHWARSVSRVSTNTLPANGRQGASEFE